MSNVGQVAHDRDSPATHISSRPSRAPRRLPIRVWVTKLIHAKKGHEVAVEATVRCIAGPHTAGDRVGLFLR